MTAKPTALILAPDPFFIDGSVGDQAIFKAIGSRLRDSYEISVLTFRPHGAERVAALGFQPVLEEFPTGDSLLDSAIKRIQSVDPQLTICMGTDVIDGYYSSDLAMQMLTYTNTAAKFGSNCVVLGSSYSAHIDQKVIEYIKTIHNSIIWCIRDPVSQGRFHEFTGKTSRLVADTAFLLPIDFAEENYLKLKSWLSSDANPKHTLGFNINFAIFKDRDQAWDFAKRAALVLTRISMKYDVRWVLIPHDFREGSGDLELLEVIFSSVKQVLGDNKIYFIDRVVDSIAIKSIAGLMDGVITGRMHLAIATLGRSRPVACFTYRDKFEGLLQHFDLPQTLLFDPSNFADNLELYLFIETFLNNIQIYQKVVERNLSKVLVLSEYNFPHFDITPNLNKSQNNKDVAVDEETGSDIEDINGLQARLQTQSIVMKTFARVIKGHKNDLFGSVRQSIAAVIDEECDHIGAQEKLALEDAAMLTLDLLYELRPAS